MRRQAVRRWSALTGVVVIALALTTLSVGPSYAANGAEIYVVQGLPGVAVDVSVDGHSVAKSVPAAKIVGPIKVGAGTRMITFSENGAVVLKSMVKLATMSSTDVVVHLPAQASGRPMVTTFRNDLSAVPRDKASLVVVHTAAVPPADVRVNGQVLFSNIANGESLRLVVPVATYRVAIVPTGETGPVILGPLDLTVKGGSLNRVYAVGDPQNKTMNVAVHVIAVATAGSDKPHQVNTGTGGQAVALEPAAFSNLFH